MSCDSLYIILCYYKSTWNIFLQETSRDLHTVISDLEQGVNLLEVECLSGMISDVHKDKLRGITLKLQNLIDKR